MTYEVFVKKQKKIIEHCVELVRELRFTELNEEMHKLYKLENYYIHNSFDQDIPITSRDLIDLGQKTIKSNKINVPKLNYNQIISMEKN